MVLRVGQGYDIHPLITGRSLIIGGVSIPFEKGLSGHSDADVLLHAIIDSLLGAAGLGDIGRTFPDNDPAWFNIDSRQLLRMTNNTIRNKGFEIVNIDTTIILEAPKLAIYIDAMRQNIAFDLEIDIQSINIKAKTNEKLGYLGNGEAVVAQSTVLCELLSSHLLQEK